MALLSELKLDLDPTTKGHQPMMPNHGKEVPQDKQPHGKDVMRIEVMILVLQEVLAVQHLGHVVETIVATTTTAVAKVAMALSKEMQLLGLNSKTNPTDITHLAMETTTPLWVLHQGSVRI